MNYLEIAQKTPLNRGVIIDKKSLIKYINIDDPLYRSLYLYDEHGKAAIETSGSVADYYGTRWIDRVIVDIDKGNDSNSETMRRTRAYLLALEDEGLSLSMSVQIFFSGSGYHLIIPNSVFNF